jgi:hypothetical protein
MASKAYGVGVIGHCADGGHDEFSYAHLCVHRILSALITKYPTVKATSAIAEGADSIFAQSAVALGIKLEVVIPFESFMSDFTKQEAYERRLCLRSRSVSEIQVNFSAKSELAYRKSMEWIVFKSSLVVAVWDGREVGTIGGTWEAVSLCKKLKKQLIHINTSTKSMNVYFNNGHDYSSARDIHSPHILRYV